MKIKKVIKAIKLTSEDTVFTFVSIDRYDLDRSHIDELKRDAMISRLEAIVESMDDDEDEGGDYFTQTVKDGRSTFYMDGEEEVIIIKQK